ncbi:sugar phosphate nucleotidyltransferase [Bacillus weihaiensis]|uniref:Mannose-1-phosphate guanylyltransferase n=1 Tax=Bacillus weihaiensis TaxID=1547283 RepID=A0A1L3MMI1_9BACI|nr:sugar phosphate nucleotidyltransferase [Bacillus weihaiensis]APH03555.1 mannose-1-phosphate guanylyltransferase [Bacillus weihaiensis]
MRLVLLSGGSGKRLWPLSNDARSKQFLKVLENGSGQRVSMVQKVWGQLEELGLATSSVIATSKSQVEILKNQLGSNIRIVEEPERRDTFPAIALAASYLHTVEGASLDEVVAMLPVDPFVDSSFFNKIKELENALDKTSANLALIGVSPTFPSSKYGYIVPSENNEKDYKKVSYFQEKPTEQQAINLIEKNAYWNCGVFAFKLGYIIDIIKQKKCPIDYEELKNNYGKLPKISFDYEVVEKTSDIIVLPYEGYWKDLGTWNTLTEEMSTSTLGKVFKSEDSSNTHVVNELEIPVSVLGIKDAIIAASPDGILVSTKDASPRIKEVIGNLDQRPMYEERRWGWYKILDFAKQMNGNEVLTKKIYLKKGKNLSYQHHTKRIEVWTIIQGEAELIQDGRITDVKSGDIIKIPAYSKHAIRAMSDLEIIEVQSGEELVEEDIIRHNIEWEDILNSTINR